MPLSAPNAITKAVLASVKLALTASIPTANPPAIPTNISEAYADVVEGGAPHALAAEWFVGVHKDPTSQNNVPPGGRATYVDEMFTQLITVSMRVTRYASDKVARDGYPLLQDKIRTLFAYFANNPYVVMAAINAELNLTATNGFIEPFVPSNPSPPIQKRGRTWFRGAAKANSQGTLAVSATLKLEGLRRIQTVGGVN